MKSLLFITVSCLVLLGCHKHAHQDDHADDQESGDGGGHGHSHGADAKSFSGAIHKEGKGITLLPETRQRLDLKLTEVTEERMPLEVAFTARVFATESKGRFEASGILSAEKARHLEAGLPVSLYFSDGDTLKGVVARTSTPISTNETEVIVRFASSHPAIALGSFLRVEASIPSDELVLTIPRQALIKGTSESFVYIQNEDAFLRTVVKPGRETGGAVEIEEGLLEGDSVVSQAAMDLWLVELRAVKGGQGCCPAPPVKGKGK